MDQSPSQPRGPAPDSASPPLSEPGLGAASDVGSPVVGRDGSDGESARRPLRYELPSVLAEQERQSRRLLLLVVRSIFIVLLVSVTVLTIASEKDAFTEFGWSTVVGLIVSAAAIGVIVLVIDAMTPNKRLSTVVGVYVGICFGLIGAVAIGALIDIIADAWEIRGPVAEDRMEALIVSELASATAALRRETSMITSLVRDRALDAPGGTAPGIVPGAENGDPAGRSAPANERPTVAEQPLVSEPVGGGAAAAGIDAARRAGASGGAVGSRADPNRTSLYLGLTKVIIGIVLCYLSVSVVLTTKDDFRLVIPYVEFAKQVRGVRPLLVDTSALIDGRINDLGHTGFFDAPIIIPRFVIDELQMLADSGDRTKRSRGRRGLDLVAKLQANPFLDVTIDDPIVEGLSVDKMLIELAHTQKLRILTTDYNLKKVAQIHGVAVLNVNDLASTLKAAVAPGESVEVVVVKPGENPNQGVGYLPDGTMVVVEEASERIGETVAVTVTNSLQTSSGRMIFGRIEPPDPGSPASMARSATTQPRATDRPSAPVGRRDPHGTGRNPRR
ncbi:MAG TPA: TRAM domain-containing protein [Phycisphaerales bacterium]|nr:TRAM domain-containing protein [Phycisphaerales bacterium]HMP37674.1 TRAM domain-containing protein [Phycisphaerales bacterium]